MDVSENSGTPKSSILIGFSIIFTIHFGVPLFLETPIWSLFTWETDLPSFSLGFGWVFFFSIFQAWTWHHPMPASRGHDWDGVCWRGKKRNSSKLLDVKKKTTARRIWQTCFCWGVLFFSPLFIYIYLSEFYKFFFGGEKVRLVFFVGRSNLIYIINPIQMFDQSLSQSRFHSGLEDPL